MMIVGASSSVQNGLAEVERNVFTLQQNVWFFRAGDQYNKLQSKLSINRSESLLSSR